MQWSSALRLAALLAVLGGCQPSIGDHCTQSTDCSPTGDRLCDTSQPNGACTIFNCLPNACPLEAACVETNPNVFGCPYDDRHAPSRLSRQMCLKKCTQDSDCRQGEGYACIAAKQYGLLVLDTDQTERVCLPATNYSVSDAAQDGLAPVCSVSGPTNPDFDAAPGYQGDASADADAGADAGDAAADAGADASDAATDALGE
jgi:hypothetical protein